MNPWHSISLGKNAPYIVNAIIEIQKGHKTKYELDKESGLLRLDRVLKTDLCYPFHYGFIPKTLGDDNDPLDILILCSEPLQPLSIVEARVLGGIYLIDNNERDDKIIGVAAQDPHLNHLQQLHDLSSETMALMTLFFEQYKKHENKIVEIKSFLSQEEAYQVIQDDFSAYQKNTLNN